MLGQQRAPIVTEKPKNEKELVGIVVFYPVS
jgi:hypothetical protein